jgi:hypothetical protein
MLRGGVKADFTQWDRKAEENLKGLNRTIQVHVKDGVVIVPQPGIRPSYLVSYKENTVITGIGLNLTDCGARSCPRLESGLHSDGGTDRREIEKCRATGD